MHLTCVATGSTGNCFYLTGNHGTRAILDAGARPEQIQRHGLELANAALFVTHEHGDHAAYAKRLQARHGATIYATAGTAKVLGVRARPVAYLGHPGAPGDAPLEGKGIEGVKAIPVLHGAEEPAAFYFSIDGERVLYLADAGQPPDIPDGAITPHVLILEANYTQERLEAQAAKGGSKLYVAGRVASGVGHLSAAQTAALAEPYLRDARLIVLFHQSTGNFDRDEYDRDPTIPQDFKNKAHFARAGQRWDTVPF